MNGPDIVSVLHEFSGEAQLAPLYVLSGGVSQT